MTQNIEVVTPTRCAACPLRSLGTFRGSSPDDVAYVQDLKAGELTVAPGISFIQEGAEGVHLFTVLSGWAFRYKTLDDGRRQIINYVLPGDLVGLQATLAEAMTHGAEALTDLVLCVFPRDKLWKIYADHPQIAYDVTWLAAREERTLDEHILSLGRKTASERVAYLLWFLFTRAREVGLVHRNRINLPMRQQHLADTLGLSLVHTNKTLQKLRDLGVIQIDSRRLWVLDEGRLRELARAHDPPLGRRPLI